MTRALILIIALALLVFGVLGLSRPAHPQVAECAPLGQIVGGLTVNFGQALASIGTIGNSPA